MELNGGERRKGGLIYMEILLISARGSQGFRGGRPLSLMAAEQNSVSFSLSLSLHGAFDIFGHIFQVLKIQIIIN